MNQIIRELKRQFAGEKLAPEQLKGLIRAGYVYRNGDEHVLTNKGRDALAQPGVYPREADQHGDDLAPVQALQGWRRDLFGADALRLKRGELALVLDGARVQVVEI